jgi:excisionase family DNA binding protein
MVARREQSRTEHDQLLTVAEAAKSIGVSVSTVWRWIASGRLPAYRLGPKAVRIKAMDAIAARAPARVQTPEPWYGMRIVTAEDLRRPMTADEKAHALAAFKEMREFAEEIRRRHGGKLSPDSARIIREERAKRSRHLAGL